MNSPYDFQPGDVVSVRFAGVLRHYGVVTYGGRVISNSREQGGVTSQTLSQFAKSRPIMRHDERSDDHGQLAHARAHRRLGSDYSLTGSNCIDFVRHTKGQRATPTQYARAVLGAFSDLMASRRR